MQYRNAYTHTLTEKNKRVEKSKFHLNKNETNDWEKKCICTHKNGGFYCWFFYIFPDRSIDWFRHSNCFIKQKRERERERETARHKHRFRANIQSTIKLNWISLPTREYIHIRCIYRNLETVAIETPHRTAYNLRWRLVVHDHNKDRSCISSNCQWTREIEREREVVRDEYCWLKAAQNKKTNHNFKWIIQKREKEAEEKRIML